MRTKARWLCRIVVMVGLGLVFAGAPSAQTTTAVDVRNFEVISVDGNRLVVRDERGTNEYTVPDDFRFTVDGKKLSVSELKAGMKGVATVTTTTTIKPVYVTEVKQGVVLKAGPGTMVIRDSEGVRKRFTQDQLNERGVQILKDGRPIRIGELREGDALTATIVSQTAPVVVTEQDVQAMLAAEPKAAPAPTTVASAAAPAQSTSTPAQSTAAPAPSTPAASPPPSAVSPASPPAEKPGLGMMWYLVIAVVIAVLVFAFARRRKAA